MARAKRTYSIARRAAAKSAAVVHIFATDDSSSPLCRLVRRDVDWVLGKASDGAISETTLNNLLLSHYLWPEVLQRLYLSLNLQLSKYPGFKPFASDAFDNSSSIGDARSAAYDRCNIICSHV